jgi:hypothetical protein
MRSATVRNGAGILGLLMRCTRWSLPDTKYVAMSPLPLGEGQGEGLCPTPTGPLTPALSFWLDRVLTGTEAASTMGLY